MARFARRVIRNDKLELSLVAGEIVSSVDVFFVPTVSTCAAPILPVFTDEENSDEIMATQKASERQVDEHGFQVQPKGFATKAIHVGQEAEQWNSMAVVPPISMSTTFKQSGPAQHAGFEYGRSGNPTRAVLEKCLAALDNGKYGLTFSSGLGVTTCLITMLKSGDHIVAGDDLYGGTNRLLRNVAQRMNIAIDFVDATDLTKIEAAVKPNTRLFWIETPTNPLLKVIDIEAVCKLAHKFPEVVVVVDNTFLSSYLQRPLDLGADIVMYSLTKYMNGHSDVIMGAAVMNDESLYERLKFLQNATGIVPSPFDCYLVNRSLKTLSLRMERHRTNSLAIAQFLEKHPKVERVLHPGLTSHPQHELAKRQTYGHSGIMSFYIKGALNESTLFLKSLEVFTLAESLGGYESLAELPSIMTHASVPAEQRAVLGITDGLIRLSVGLEDVEDLIADLEQALGKI
ncbi:cystathionine gamma-lyase [Toxorhynchites rutilus septentrionalis]|uniref:cystathionine gamma-lyase n=1 Tax=Toxorhynchites rutilus septentrionalis TaxID=329112 RepID=UPI0024792226|nr:cystathionine gamma-lyase [Toxorhynchites rutilus septentrionalis]